MQSAKSQIESLRVLVVEDDADIRESLEELLASEGVHVAGAANGLEALSYLRAHALPDVILLDLMMPVMDGAEFRGAQLADARLASIPIVLLSANRDASAVGRALGASEVLSKPLELQALVDAVERACAPRSGVGASRTRSPAVGGDAATDVRRKTVDASDERDGRDASQAVKKPERA